jgi:hypothetical protein
MDFIMESEGKKIQIILLDSEVAEIKPVAGKPGSQRVTVCTMCVLRTGLSQLDRLAESAFCHPVDKTDIRGGRIRALRRVLKDAVSFGYISRMETVPIWDRFYQEIGEVNPRLKNFSNPL